MRLLIHCGSFKVIKASKAAIFFPYYSHCTKIASSRAARPIILTRKKSQEPLQKPKGRDIILREVKILSLLL